MDEQYGYLTTRGRRTGRPHEIEIWFAVHDGRYWLIAGGGESSDWVRNIRADRSVRWRVGERTSEAVAEVVEDAAAAQVPRQRLAAKYQGWSEGRPLSDWAAHGLVVAITPLVTAAGAGRPRDGGDGGGEPA
jgi:deazaflavin-dependent oxidoreductase (nitroreductase family)